MIILTFSDANHVRGVTANGAMLDPRPLRDGNTFVLPIAVLADPNHAMHLEFLSGLPTRDVLPEEWPDQGEA